MSKTIAVLATLDTKGDEASFLKEQLAQLGSDALLVDMGVIGEPAIAADVSREEVAKAGGTPLADLLQDPSREVRPGDERQAAGMRVALGVSSAGGALSGASMKSYSSYNRIETLLPLADSRS